MVLHRIFNGNTDAVIFGPDGQIWEALTSREIDLTDSVQAELALRRLTDLGPVAASDETTDVSTYVSTPDEGVN